MAAVLQRAWLHRGWLAWLLLPITAIYATVSGLHRAVYRTGLRGADRLPVPVVVVGNVVAGGAGKTPVVIALVQHLRARGIVAGVVSRGYGRATLATREVHADSDPRDVGDEPLLIHRRTQAPVFVARRRSDAARALLAVHPGVQVIVSDDGLQHLALARDIEVCVFDERGVGNGWLLPSGPLREPWPRRADLVLRPPSGEPRDGFDVTRELASFAARADGSRIALPALAAAPFTALAGIARPDAFFTMLRAGGLHPSACIALPDHADFAAVALPAGALVCTEKDAVKLWRVRPDAWAVALESEIDPRFWQALDRRLAPKLSSAHGSQTA